MTFVVALKLPAVIVKVPPRFNTEEAPCVNSPDPESAVEAVTVPLLIIAPLSVSAVADVRLPELVRVIVVTVTLGIDNVPVNV